MPESRLEALRQAQDRPALQKYRLKGSRGGGFRPHGAGTIRSSTWVGLHSSHSTGVAS